MGPRQRGFALVIALGLMAFVLLLVLAMVTLVRVEASASASHKQLTLARQNALLGVQLALGQLQKEMGPDRRISATASLLDSDPETNAIDDVTQPHWTGVWESFDWDRESEPNLAISSLEDASDGKPAKFRAWLVSGFTDTGMTGVEKLNVARQFTSQSSDAVQLLGEGTLGTAALAQTESVYAQRQSVPVDSQREGGYAYWVGDEGVKARFGNPVVEEADDHLKRIYGVSSMERPNLSAVEGWEAFTDTESNVEKVFDYGALEAVAVDELDQVDAFAGRFHSITPYSSGLLTDVRRGGFRKDLSLLFSQTDLPALYQNQPLFEIGPAIGPTWNYVKRYHNRYRMLETESDGTAALNILDVKPEVADLLEPNKPGDAPLPVVVRFQYIFSLYKGNNTLDGKPFEASDAVDGETNFQSDEKIIYLMVTPVLYFWNPYNVAIRMPEGEAAAMNILTAFPPLEFSFDDGSSYKRFDDMFWFYQNTLIALQSSNTDEEELFIPPGEIRINTLQSGDYGGKLYLFYGSSSGDPGLEDFFGTVVQKVNPRGGNRNQKMTLGFGEGTMGLFSPALKPGNRPASPDTKLLASGTIKIRARFDPNATRFLFKTNVGGEGANGERQQAGVFHVNSSNPITDIYLPSEYEHPAVSLDGAPEMMDGENFTGLNPLFIVNYDMRAFDEIEGLGKPGLYTDPTNGYFYSEETDEKALALSPFRVTFEIAAGSGDYIQYDPSTERAGIQIGSDIVQYNVAKELPMAPLLSVAQLEHAPLGRDYQHLIYQNTDFDSSETPPSELPDSNPERRTMAPVFNRPVGNSFLHPMIEANRVWDGAYAVDRSYLLNDVLFDSYFFSGIANQAGPFANSSDTAEVLLENFLAGDFPLPNSNYTFTLPEGFDRSSARAALSEVTVGPGSQAFERLAAFLSVKGTFNINSTSVDAWAAMLSALKGKSVVREENGAGYTSQENSGRVPALSVTVPVGDSVESNGADYMSAYEALWKGYRAMNETQVRELAEAIVREVKARGPFLSLSQFVNREASLRGEYNQSGALEASIKAAEINTTAESAGLDAALLTRFGSNEMDPTNIDAAGFAAPSALEGDRNEGMPGYLTQAQLLKPLAPQISARSDTFVIRSYGDVEVGGRIVARVWCEAVVQRRPDYVPEAGAAIDPWDEPDPAVNSIAEAFGRKLEVISFRWLSSDEV